MLDVNEQRGKVKKKIIVQSPLLIGDGRVLTNNDYVPYLFPIAKEVWVYASSLFPDGISEDVLRESDFATQTFVAVWWFCSDFKQSNHLQVAPATKDGKGISEGEVKNARPIFEQEFNGIIHKDKIELTAQFFPGFWISSKRSSGRPEDEILADTLRRLHTLGELINRLPFDGKNDRRGVGGNYPPESINEDVALPQSLRAERDKALAVISIVEGEINSGESGEKILESWENIEIFLDKLQNWMALAVAKTGEKMVELAVLGGIVAIVLVLHEGLGVGDALKAIYHHTINGFLPNHK